MLNSPPPVPPRESSTGRETNSSRGETSAPHGVAVPTITLPKGGGAIRGIGEKFAANPVTGTGAITVPLVASPGRSGFGPQLALAYDSGAGNGPFGFGWSLSVPSITRKTEKGLPQYREDEESDTFILSGAEDLVPVLVEQDGTWIREVLSHRRMNGATFRVERYRPRSEGMFARIERWTDAATRESHWRSISKDNVTTVYGVSPESRIFDPDEPTHIFAWLICQSYDDKGNAIVYAYKPEDSAGVQLAAAHEANRTDRTRQTNRYLKRILYGNRTPNRDTAWRATDPALLTDWMFEVVFDYGEGHYAAAEPNKDGQPHITALAQAPFGAEWPVRPDSFSTHRSGFEVRTYRLCRRVLMFHHFPAELGIADCLVRSTEFSYAEGSIASFIRSVTQSGYVHRPSEDDANRYLKQSLPPVEFEYSRIPGPDEIAAQPVREVDPADVENLPYGLDAVTYRWVDLDGEGVPGILTQQGSAWFYKRNLSPLPREDDRQQETVARFAPLEILAQQPSLFGLGSAQAQFLDLAGDGQVELVQFSRPLSGFYERTTDANWSSFVPFQFVPTENWDDPNLRFADLTGDGRADILVTRDNVLHWYPSLAEQGFDAEHRVAQAVDEEYGPRLLFADRTQSVFLADLSGDGLTDLVRVRNGEVCYWPNLGYGRFGAKVTMDSAPWFDAPDLFDQRRIQLADIDGSGVTDIIYIGRDGISIYFNQSGNRWSDALALRTVPQIDNLADITAVDLLGNGTACLVWSSPLPGNTGRAMRYIDLMGGQKPHLLVKTSNNLGAETYVHYAPSTKFYLADKAAGQPWITKLPFPVHVVERVETYDRISRNRFVARYAYHHGYFDGVEREFRGFGLVEQLDTEEFAALSAGGMFPSAANVDATSHVPPVLTRTWFHTGAFVDNEHISRQFAHEYYSESDPAGHSELTAAQQAAMLLPDTLLPELVRQPNKAPMRWGLSPDEVRQACRALKGSILRQEIYAQDGSEAAGRPYMVSERNYTIELLQPLPPGRQVAADKDFAVFYVHPRETVDCHYERKVYAIGSKKLADPRVSHQLTLAVDDYGNVLQSVAIGYGRRHADPDPLLTPADRAKQGRLHLTCTEAGYTNAIDEEHDYRAPLPCEARTYELLKFSPQAAQPQVTNLFRFEELAAKLQAVSSGDFDLLYEQWDVDAATLAAPARRLIEHVRTIYRRNDLDGALPPGELESLALPYESYSLAFTPALVAKIYGERVTEAMLAEEGRYVHCAGDTNWWVPFGRIFYSPDPADAPPVELANAQAHFFLPRRYHNPFDNVTTVSHDPYDLLMQEMRDAVDNRITAGERDEAGALVTNGNDYRVLQPRLVMDANRNRAAVAFDALGMVVGTAVMGKPEENLGDTLDGFAPDLPGSAALIHMTDPLSDPASLLQRATTRLVYDLFAYWRTREDPDPQPTVVANLSRETHHADLVNDQHSRIQHSLSYSDGFGREIQKKVQAEPGPLEEGDSAASPRWVGTGWTIFNNKGKPIRQYEPFFSGTHFFEFAATVGISAVLFYDPVERVVAILHPNNTWEKTVFDPWHQETWDVNDTVLRNPKNDQDVGGYVKPFLDSLNGWQTWHTQRTGGSLGIQEQHAAEKTEAHADTPAQAWFDSLARKVLTIAHNRFGREGIFSEDFSASRTAFDIEGNQREVTDALGRSVMRYDYDMLGNALRQASMESGTRWIFNDVGTSSIYIWNSRGFRLHMEYDPLRRSIRQRVQGQDGQELLAERTVYGEVCSDSAALNLRGKSYLQFDRAGVVRHDQYDFKGNLLRSTRRLSREYRQTVSWDELETQLSAGQLELDLVDVELSSLLEDDEFVGETVYDAHNRPVAVISPDASVVYLTYNEANLLERLDTKLRGAEIATPFITNIDYDARGRRQSITYGNNTTTLHTYDPLTLRLRHLKTLREDVALQDFQYTYDPVGNIVIVDDRVQPLVYFNNAVVSASTAYVYDALYQLIEATGREHIGLATMPRPTWEDLPRTGLFHPNDSQALRRYREQYQYDLVGNLLEMVHSAVNGNWQRVYDYAEVSLLEPSQINNRLSSTRTGSITERYLYDEHGNTTATPDLSELNWDAEDQFCSADLGGGGRSYYLYDTAGRRVRKVIERQNGTRQKERIYVGGFETYREYSGDGEALKLERQTLQIIDDKERIALVETKTFDSDIPTETPEPLIRYQLANHLGSASLELDETAAIISYEDYYPFGGTSYQASRSAVEVSRKRYRYTGKERDDETGLYYYGARYYAPWLGRWISCDPAGLVDGSNAYRYTKNNPINATDPTGMWEMPSWRTVAVVAAVVVVGTVVTVATAGAAGPLVVGAVASVGLTGTAATVATGVAVGAIAGAVGGAAAGAAGEGTRQTVNSRALGLGNEEFSGGKILSAAGEGAATGAAIGAAVGGATAFATTAVGTAAIGAVGRVAQRVTPAVVRSGASAAARTIGTAASAVARTPGVRQALSTTTRSLQAIEGGGRALGSRAAANLFASNPTAASTLGTLAQTNSVAEAFGATESRAAAELSRGITRATPGVGPGAVRFGDLGGGAKRIVREMARTGSADIGAGARVEDIRAASEFLGREIGVAQSQSTGALRAALGNQTGLTSAMRRADETWLVHTHPVYESVPGHFALDIRTAGSRIEAVVDWGGNITHFNNTGILANPTTSPINPAGYIRGY